MDPLTIVGAVSSAVQLLGAVVSVTNELFQFFDGLQGSRDEIRDLLAGKDTTPSPS